MSLRSSRGFLKLWVFVEPWARTFYGLQASDLKMLLYLEELDWFTVKDFKEGTLWLSWDRKRIYRLQREGWIDKVFSGRGRKGEFSSNKYKVSQKGSLMTRRLYKLLDGQEDIPESAKRNQRIKGERHSQLIRKINRENKN